jgi:hypothetical protein
VVLWKRRDSRPGERPLKTDAYAGGYTDGTVRYFFPIATRNVLLTTRFYS